MSGQQDTSLAQEELMGLCVPPTGWNTQISLCTIAHCLTGGISKKTHTDWKEGGKYGPKCPHGTAEPNRQAKKQQQAMKINVERNAEEGEAGDAVLEARSLKSASGVSEGCALLSYMPSPPGVRLCFPEMSFHV